MHVPRAHRGTHRDFHACWHDNGSEGEGVWANGRDDHTRNTGVHHAGTCCQRVGRTSCGRGNDDAWRWEQNSSTKKYVRAIMQMDIVISRVSAHG